MLWTRIVRQKRPANDSSAPNLQTPLPPKHLGAGWLLHMRFQGFGSSAIFHTVSSWRPDGSHGGLACFAGCTILCYRKLKQGKPAKCWHAHQHALCAGWAFNQIHVQIRMEWDFDPQEITHIGVFQRMGDRGQCQ
jgi:hypothetical protein